MQSYDSSDEEDAKGADLAGTQQEAKQELAVKKIRASQQDLSKLVHELAAEKAAAGIARARAISAKWRRHRSEAASSAASGSAESATSSPAQADSNGSQAASSSMAPPPARQRCRPSTLGDCADTFGYYWGVALKAGHENKLET